MNTLLRKEFRLLLPALVATVVMVVVPTWGTHFAWFARNGWMVGMAALVCFTFGILFLALSPFGQEISLGTFSLMLAQPRPRQEIWWVKMGALGATVALSLAVLGLSWYLRGRQRDSDHGGRAVFEYFARSGAVARNGGAGRVGDGVRRALDDTGISAGDGSFLVFAAGPGSNFYGGRICDG
jgi:hypothetical protein